MIASPFHVFFLRLLSHLSAELIKMRNHLVFFDFNFELIFLQMGKKQKNIKDITIQETNDSSILSKASITRLGYFNDPYLALFTTRVPRRAPLIHRGYYIRAKAIDHTLRSFLNHAQHLNTAAQIVSLGAGFDTSYFRLKEKGLLGKNCRYVEIDFPDVIRRKRNIIDQHQVLKNVIGEYTLDSDDILKTEDLVILPCDLTDSTKLNEIIGKRTGIRFDIPTLFFSECVLTYVEYERSVELLRWIAQRFEHSAVIIYEQIRPDDAFGRVMMRHFDKIQSPLQRIRDLSTIQKHTELFHGLGFEEVVGFDMNFFFTHYLDQEEKSRMMNLEPFDEFEEWHLKCSHYCITAGFTGLCVCVRMWDISAFISIFHDSSFNENWLFPKHNISGVFTQFPMPPEIRLLFSKI